MNIQRNRLSLFKAHSASSRWWHAVIVLVALAVSGCAQWKMMPSPVSYQAGGEDPFAAMAEVDRRSTIEVFYATDRAPVDNPKPAEQYDKNRGIKLRLGEATVRLGDEDTPWSVLADQSRSSDNIPMELVNLREFGPLWTTVPLRDEAFLSAWASDTWDDEARVPARNFVDAVNVRLATSSWKEIVIYIPGVNTPFVSPINMMAQFSHFMGRDGVFIAYSWPARGNPFSYSKQVTTSGISVRNLRELILLLAEKSDARKINLIGYSAGAPVMSNALLQLRLIHSGKSAEDLRSTVPIGRVIYVGADEDHQYFSNLYLDGFQDITDSVTIYTSTDDLALKISTFFTTGSARLGNVRNNLSANELAALSANRKTFVVDAENAKNNAGKGDAFAHGYWYGNAWVNQDIINLLRSGRAPAERGLVRSEDDSLWEFPEDYPERLRAISSMP